MVASAMAGGTSSPARPLSIFKTELQLLPFALVMWPNLRQEALLIRPRSRPTLLLGRLPGIPSLGGSGRSLAKAPVSI